jgi:hypothetical protein
MMIALDNNLIVMARNSGPSRNEELNRRADARRLDGPVKRGHDMTGSRFNQLVTRRFKG